MVVAQQGRRLLNVATTVALAARGRYKTRGTYAHTRLVLLSALCRSARRAARRCAPRSCMPLQQPTSLLTCRASTASTGECEGAGGRFPGTRGSIAMLVRCVVLSFKEIASPCLPPPLPRHPPNHPPPPPPPPRRCRPGPPPPPRPIPSTTPTPTPPFSLGIYFPRHFTAIGISTSLGAVTFTTSMRQPLSTLGTSRLVNSV